MAANDIALNLIADTTKATKGIEKFSKNTSKSLAKVEKSFSALKVIAGAAVAVFAGTQIVRGIKAVTDAASVQEDAVNSLNTALRTSGEYSKAASLDMQSFASEIQNTTTFGDELVLSQLSLAKAFGATNDQAKDVVKAATELAAATGKSLDEATRQVSKTLGGFAGELGEVNPAIKALTAEQLKAGEAAKILIQQYSGTAASKLQTFSGVVESTGNVFGDLLEAIGALITKNPAVIKAVEAMKDLFSALIESVEDNEEAFSSFVTMLAEGFTEVVRWLAQVLPKVVGYMAAFAKVLTKIDWREVAEGAATFAAVWYGSKGLLYAFNVGLPAVAALAGKFTLLAVGVLAVAGAVDLLRANWNKLGTAFQRLEMDVYIAKQQKLVETMREGIEIWGFQLQAPNPEGLARAQKRLEKMLAEKRKLDDNFAKTDWSGGITEQLLKIKDQIGEIGKTDIDLTIPEVGVGKLNLPEEIEKLEMELEGLGEKEKERQKTFFQQFGRMMMFPAEQWLNVIKNFDEVGTDYLDRVQKVWGQILPAFGSVAKDVLSGRKGAEKIITQALDVVGAIYGIPGVGQALAPFMSGADQVKTMVNEFAAALPDITVDMIEGLVAGMDTIVDALITSLIDEGGLERIMIALAKAAPRIGIIIAFGFVGYLTGRTLIAIFERLGIDMGRNFGQEILTWFEKLSFAKLLEDFEKVLNDIAMVFEGLFSWIAGFIGTLFDNLQMIGDYLRALFEAFPTSFRESWNDMIQSLYTLWERVYEALREVFTFYISGYQAIYDAMRRLVNMLPEFFQKMIDDFKDIFNLNLKNIFSFFLKIVQYMGDVFDWFLDYLVKIFEYAENIFDYLVEIFEYAENIFDWFLDNLFGWAEGLDFGSSSANPENWFKTGGAIYARNGARGSDNIPVFMNREERILSAEQNMAFEKMPVLLTAILAELQKGQTVETSLDINGRTFANVILEMSRRNERLTV
jgi:hypothetical protein